MVGLTDDPAIYGTATPGMVRLAMEDLVSLECELAAAREANARLQDEIAELKQTRRRNTFPPGGGGRRP